MGSGAPHTDEQIGSFFPHQLRHAVNNNNLQLTALFFIYSYSHFEYFDCSSILFCFLSGFPTS